MKIILRFITIITVLSLKIVHADSTSFDPPFAELIERLRQDELDSAFVIPLFQNQQVKFNENLISRHLVPAETQAVYDGFLQENQIADGCEFLQKNKEQIQALLMGSEIPIEIVVAILKVESNFGRRTGDEQVFSTLATVASLQDRKYWESLVNSNQERSENTLKKRARKRSEWAYKEMRSFIELCQIQGWDPLYFRGSWAGAFGIAQFLPSSYLHYGRDGSGDEAVDPDNLQDATASLIYYLEEARWGSSEQSQRKALLRYNPSSAYADCILEYARKLRMCVETTEINQP